MIAADDIVEVTSSRREVDLPRSRRTAPDTGRVAGPGRIPSTHSLGVEHVETSWPHLASSAVVALDDDFHASPLPNRPTLDALRHPASSCFRWRFHPGVKGDRLHCTSICFCPSVAHRQSPDRPRPRVVSVTWAQPHTQQVRLKLHSKCRDAPRPRQLLQFDFGVASIAQPRPT